MVGCTVKGRILILDIIHSLRFSTLYSKCQIKGDLGMNMVKNMANQSEFSSKSYIIYIVDIKELI